MRNFSLHIFFFLIILPLFAFESYDLQLEIKPEEGLIEGWCTVQIRPQDYLDSKLLISLALNSGEKKNPHIYGPLQEYYGIFQENGPEGFSPSWADISQLEVNGEPQKVRFFEKTPPNGINYNLDKLFVEIQLPQRKEPVTLKFYYKAKLSHGRGLDNYFFNERMASRFFWFPYVLPIEKVQAIALRPFYYRAKIALPQEWELVQTGTSFQKTSQGQFSVESTAPVSSFPLFAVKNFEKYYQDLPDIGKKLAIYYSPKKSYFSAEKEVFARLISTYATEALRFFAKTYFPLDGNYISIVENTDSIFNVSMACDGIIMLSGKVFAGRHISDRVQEYIVVHELCHLYFGLGNAPDILRDNYLSEGLCDAATTLYMEEKYGRWSTLRVKRPTFFDLFIPSSLSESLRGNKINWLRFIHDSGFDDRLAHADSAERLLNNNGRADYDQPLFVMSILAKHLKISLNELLQGVVKEFYHKNCSTDSFQQFLEKKYNINLKVFFDTYIRSPGWIDYELKGHINQKEGEVYNHTLTVSDFNKTPVFIPTVLTLRFQDGQEKNVDINTPGEVTLTSAQEIVWAALDWQVEALDLERKNNFFPGLLFPSNQDPQFQYFAFDRIKPRGIIQFPRLLEEPDPKVRFLFNADLGIGMELADQRSYRFTFGAIYNLSYHSSLRFGGEGFGVLSKLNLFFPSDTILSFISRTMVAAHYQDFLIEVSKKFNLEQNFGQNAKLYYPVLILKGQAELLRGDWLDFNRAYFQGSLSLKINNLIKSGTYASLSQIASWGMARQRLEDRTETRLFQLLPAPFKTVFAFSALASFGFGEIERLGVRNSALMFFHDRKWYNHKVSAALFCAYPVVAFPTTLTNFFNLPTLFLSPAIIYEATTAWNSVEIPSKIQHAVGLGLSLLPIPAIIGASFNLNKISFQDQSSYTPRFFLKLLIPDILGLLAH